MTDPLPFDFDEISYILAEGAMAETEDTVTSQTIFHPEGYMVGGIAYLDNPKSRRQRLAGNLLVLIGAGLAALFVSFELTYLFMPAGLIVFSFCILVSPFYAFEKLREPFRKHTGVYRGSCPHCKRVIFSPPQIAFDCPVCKRRIVIENHQFTAI